MTLWLLLGYLLGRTVARVGGWGQTQHLNSALCSTCGHFTWDCLVLWCSSFPPEKRNIATSQLQCKLKENENHEVLRSCCGGTVVLCKAGLITVSSRLVHAAVACISINNLMRPIWAYSSVVWWLVFATLVAQRSLISGGDLFSEVNTRGKTSDIQRFHSQTEEDARNPARDLQEEKLEAVMRALPLSKTLCTVVHKVLRTWVPPAPPCSSTINKQGGETS